MTKKQKRAVMAVQKALDNIDWADFHNRVMVKHVKFVEKMDRIRSRSWAACANMWLD